MIISAKVLAKFIGGCILTKVSKPTALIDYFTKRDGQTFAGVHLLVDIWNGKNLTDPEHIETVLRNAAHASGATILHSHLHHFSPSGGVSGVVILAESHISIHTWPERDFAAIDIFMCGDCDPLLAIPVLKEGFKSETLDVNEIRRGVVS